MLNNLTHVNFQNPVTGFTNKIEIEEATGERKNFNVEIMELSNSGFNNIAKWNASGGFVYVRSPNEVSDLLAEKWQNKTFRVVSRIGAPYLIEKVPEEGQVLTGNDRYEGYSKDLIHEILKETLKLNYELEIVPGNGYGKYDKDTKKWDGLVGHLLDHVSVLIYVIYILSFNIDKDPLRVPYIYSFITLNLYNVNISNILGNLTRR